MIRRAAIGLSLTLLAAGCGAQTDKPATSRQNVTAPAAASTPHAARPHRDIAGAGVGAPEFAAVQRLARKGYPVYCGGTKRNLVALTFDDGPGPYTHYVLKRLRRNHMRATFFLNTKNLGTFRPIIKTELPYGTVGDHTANHLYLPGLGSDQQHAEIDDAQREIGKDAGFPITLFRAPYGATNAAIEDHVKQRQML